MSKIIEKLVISTVAPENKYVGWLKEDPEEEKLSFQKHKKIFRSRKFKNN